MKKKALAAVLLAVVMLTGCSMEQKVTINPDLSSVVSQDTYMTVAEEKEMLADLGADENASFSELMKESGFTFIGTKEINGVVYNQYTATEQKNPQDTKESFIELSNQKAVLDIASESQVQKEDMSSNVSMNYAGMGFCNVTITYPFEVGKTNGALQADGCTVLYDVVELNKQNHSRAYAIAKTALTAADTITVSGVKNNKAYKKAVTIDVSADSAIASFAVNGKNQAANTYYAKKNGKYTVIVKSATGATKTISFCVDSKKPTTNVKNKKTYNKAVKITFKDTISGIKKATLNGKKIKSGKKVKNNGDYTLKIYDKAGNVKTVKFTIKK